MTVGGTRAGRFARRGADGRARGFALRRRAALALVAAALATVVAGCSLSGAHPASTTSPGSVVTAPSARAGSTVARADRTHEVPTPSGGESVTGGWRSPTQAVYVFATQYINWNSRDVSARLRALAQVSVGQARSAMSAAASQTAADDELKQGQITNSGVVEAIAPVIGHRYAYAVATRERTSASATNAYQGIAPEWHLALATVTRLDGGLWVLSDWQPEN